MDGKHFAKFVKISRALGIPYSVVCDRDALESIEAGVSGRKGRIPCSVVLSQLYDLRLMTYGQVESALRKSKRRGAQVASYPPEIVARLLPTVRKHRIFVWPSDLEATLESFLTEHELKEIELETRGKVVRGRALALALVGKGRLPPDLTKELLRIVRMRTRGPETST